MSKNGSGAHLFLIELLICILFLSLCSAYCMKLFAQAKTTSILCEDKSKGILYCQSALETFRAAKGDKKETARILDVDYSQIASFGLDQNMEPSENAVYNAKITFEEKKGLVEMKIELFREEESLVSLSTKYFKGEEQK